MTPIPAAHFLLGLLLTAFLSMGMARAATPDDGRSEAWMAEHYTKHEHRIPMRDGVRLFARVYVPKDGSTRWPILLTRTPYALKPYGAPVPASDEAERVMYAALKRGLNFKVTMGTILTLTPALVISRGEMDQSIGILEDGLTEAGG